MTRIACVGLAALLGLANTSALADPGHEEERTVVIETRLATVGATILHPAPHGGGALPCVVIAGGSLSHGRDGDFLAGEAPPRDALRRLARALSAGGYASLRYDKVGYGASRPKSSWRGSYADEARVLAEVVAFTRTDERFDSVVVAGESAGAYLACLAAKSGSKADAYLFLGGHCGPGEEIYEYNFGRLVQHVDRFPENRMWAADLRRELALGRHYREMVAAAARGEDSFQLVDGDLRVTLDLRRRREELEMPPDRMFRFIDRPALALAGELDLNVAPAHADKAAAIMKEAGNARAVAVVVENADHSFQQGADSEHERIRERYTFESFRRPYQPQAYREILRWLRETVPTPISADFGRLEGIAGVGEDGPREEARRGLGGVEVEPATEYVPERVHLAPGVEIVDDVTDETRTAGVETLEGRIGPLILGEGSQAHFIDMPSGMYVEEHPHSSESLIYTVRGRWVLCSAGRRHVMRPGSLFRFAAKTPTGYEVPFEEDAYLLIFKGDRLSESEKVFIEYLRGLRDRLLREQKDGVPYLLRDLRPDHPARMYAREVNPAFEASLGGDS